MALFMPTAVTPSLTGALGNGVVDASKDMAVSWQVNGNTPMTAFQIVLYKNDTNSTQIYSTGKLTEGCPFYGKNAKGVPQTFSYTLAASVLSGAGMVNGEAYKLVITQWWSDTESVVQSSASAFITRAAPVLTMGEIGTISSKNATFTADYSQEQGDALNWVRWRIAYADDTENPFYDTQNLYGVSDLSASYDGFFSGEQYAVRLSVQTERGVEADTGWITFSCAYDLIAITDTVKACAAPKPASAVYVSWNGISYIYGEASGPYNISSDGMLSLPAGSSVTWNDVNGAAMAISAPWNILLCGTLSGTDGTIFTLTHGEGNISASYDMENREFRVSVGDSAYSVSGVHPDAEFRVILTPSEVLVRIDQLTGGLYPADTLYPGTAVYPATDTIPQVLQQTFSSSYTQGAVTQIQIFGSQQCDYIQAISGDLPDSIRSAVYQTGDYAPTNIAGTAFFADFREGLNAGTTNLGGEEITGWTVYRQKSGEKLLRRIADLPLAQTALCDYGAASQQGGYIYYVFPHNDTTFLSNPLVSGEINPVFWNWSILVCREQEDGVFTVEKEFAFGKNLQSGAISNNNTPGIFENFTAYPAVQLSPQNYRSGTLQSLIGAIGMDAGGRYDYRDSIELRDAIYGLSTETGTLFLKNRKGDLMQIRISGPITMTTSDNTRQQMQTASIPWAEVGPTDAVSLISAAPVASEPGSSGSSGGSGSDYIPNPLRASVGQTIRVSAVDADGKPIAWEVVDFPSGVGVTAEQAEALNGIFLAATYKDTPTEAYSAFCRAFGVTGGDNA